MYIYIYYIYVYTYKQTYTYIHILLVYTISTVCICTYVYLVRVCVCMYLAFPSVALGLLVGLTLQLGPMALLPALDIDQVQQLRPTKACHGQSLFPRGWSRVILGPWHFWQLGIPQTKRTVILGNLI